MCANQTADASAFRPPSALERRRRAERIFAAHGDRLPDSQRTVSWAWNDVWVRPHAVLHAANTSYQGLAVEAALAPLIPAGVGYPRVIDSGSDNGLPWLLQGRLAGGPLGMQWAGLSVPQARSALGDVVDRLRLFHTLEHAPELVRRREPTCYALRPRTARRIIRQLRELGVLDAGLESRVLEIHHLMCASLAGQPVGVVHGDLHLDNVVYDPQRHCVTGIVDFEDCGWAPLELDYFVLARSVASSEQPQALAWLRDIMSASLSSTGSTERWAGYALARVLGRTVWDPTVDLDTIPLNDQALGELHDDLLAVVAGQHVGARLLG